MKGIFKVNWRFLLVLGAENSGGKHDCTSWSHNLTAAIATEGNSAL